ncbi:MAG: hypothetical protein ACLQNE_36760 [Thermoguttaceae bacterium]|jgi:hypothetical protein
MNKTIMRRLLSQNPVATCVVLGATAGLLCGLFEVFWDFIKYGISEKLGATFQFGFQAPISIGMFVLGGTSIGYIIGLIMAVVRIDSLGRLVETQGGDDTNLPQPRGGSPLDGADRGTMVD